MNQQDSKKCTGLSLVTSRRLWLAWCFLPAGLAGTALGALYMKANIEYAIAWLVLSGGIFGCLLAAWLFFSRRNPRLAAEALEKSELFTSSRDGIVVIDGGGGLLQANAAFCRMLGYRQEELMALRYFSELTPAKWHEWEAGEIWNKRLLQDGYSGLYEKEYVRKDGSVFPVELQSFIFFNHDHTPRYMWSVVRDISNRVRLEEEKKLLEAGIRNKQRLETIGTLAGGIANDFNNILVPILGYAELSMSMLPPESQLYKYSSEIMKAAERAQNLVAQIMTFSRPAENRQKPLDVRLLLKEALKLLRPAIPATIAIEQHIDTPCRNVLADPSHIHQIILNLCTNAFHAMETAGGTLTIELREAAAADCPACCNSGVGYLMLRVTDTGTGMDAATMERIFEPFFTTKPVNKGTGLGLSVVYGIVQSCKGEITVASAEGRGSTFKIFLPVIEADAEESQDAGSPVRGGGRVLCIDDEPANLQLMLAMLSRLGYIIETETSPVKALDLFSRAPESFDLVITDLAMPGMTGMELAEKIHRESPGLPVILMTGYGSDIDETAALERCGIRQILKKPVKLHILASSINETINLSRR